MSIARRVQLVEELFHQLELESAQFEKTSGLQCVAGCGKCCTNTTIEASPLEFLPWAYHIFQHGLAAETLIKLKESDSLTCSIFKSFSVPGKGTCTNYKYRGLICRLFGFGANKDKYANLRLVTCKIIKEGQAEIYKKTSERISKGLSIPIFTDYYMQLNQIDFHLGNLILPVNKALIRALEEVLHYYAYRPFPEVDTTTS